MRVGIYDPYLDDLGGGEKYMMTIASSLSKDHDVSVFWENKKDLDGLVERFSIDLSKVVLAPNIFSSKYSFISRLKESRNYDAIIILSDGSIPLLLSKLYVHIQHPIFNLPNNMKSKLKKRRVNSFFCNSIFTKEYVDKEFQINSALIYPPVVIRKKNIKKKNIILTVGRFRVKNVEGLGDYKKQGFMIQAFKKMIDSGLKNWKFVVATSVKEEDGEEFEKMKATAKGYPIEFLVNKNNDGLWGIYSEAKIYWHASGYGEDLVKHPEFAEHFGISTVEAMGAGEVPVVINAGGQKEIVENGINGFLWNSLEDLCSKTLKLTNDEKLLDKLSKEASQRAKFFSDNKFGERIKNLLKN